jgi:hypothetical protein
MVAALLLAVGVLCTGASFGSPASSIWDLTAVASTHGSGDADPRHEGVAPRVTIAKAETAHPSRHVVDELAVHAAAVVGALVAFRGLTAGRRATRLVRFVASSLGGRAPPVLA